MFDLRSFILHGLKDAVGKLADYQVVLNAAGWHEKGVLLEEDLVEISALIESKNTINETIAEDIEITEEDDTSECEPETN